MLPFSGTTSGDGYGNYPPPGSGDWHITMDTYVGNQSIYLEGNVWVETGASLTLNNVNLYLIPQYDGHYSIVVNGTFNILYSKIRSLEWMDDIEHNYSIRYYGGSASGLVESSNISNCGTEENLDGFVIQSSNGVKIYNSTFYNGGYNGIMAWAQNVEIVNNTINKMGRYGINAAWDTRIEDNRIYNTDYGGLSLFSFSGVINNCTIENCGNAIEAAGLNPIIENCTLRGSRWESIRLIQCNLTLLNTTDDKEQYDYWLTSDTLTKKWYLNVKVVNPIGNPIAGATVRVRDNANGTFDANYTTNSDGWARLIVCNESYENQTNGIVYTPHNVTASYGITSNESVPIQFMNASKELIIQLDVLPSAFETVLHDGWNFVSFPLMPVNTSIESVLGSIAGSYDMVQYYDALASIHWKNYATFKPTGLNDLDVLDNRMGFWLHITSGPVALTIDGYEPISTNIDLFTGWNMVAYPSSTNRTVQTALAGLPWDSVEAENQTASYGISEMQATDNMIAGKGYWIKVSSDCVWTVDY